MRVVNAVDVLTDAWVSRKDSSATHPDRLRWDKGGMPIAGSLYRDLGSLFDPGERTLGQAQRDDTGDRLEVTE